MQQIKVELIYLADETDCFHRHYEINPDTTIEQLINDSELLKLYPALKLDELTCGIFSKKVSLAHQLQDGERVEIYRPLTISPMEKRRLLAKNK